MDDDDTGGLGLRDWGCYYEQQQPYNNNKNNDASNTLGLQLMSNVGVDHHHWDTKNLLSNGAAYLHRECGPLSSSSMPMPPPTEFVRDDWMHYGEKMIHTMPVRQPGHAALAEARQPLPHHLQMVPHTGLSLVDVKPVMFKGDSNGSGGKGAPGKKRPRCLSSKTTPKPKNPRKVPAPKDEAGGNGSASRGRFARKSAEIVINGIGLDISGIPTPVCSCTGMPQQCYRWGVGGWQSACCTTSMSEYPLPMSTKRRGARIAGRKMSQGAFKKVLEKLANEGYNLSNPIDLRPFWAKHGTNKFVTIR